MRTAHLLIEMMIARFDGGAWLCCTNTMGDSCHEAGVLTGKHEQTLLTDLQDHELA